MFTWISARLQTPSLERRYGAYVTHVDPCAIRYLRRQNEWPRYVKRWPWLVCGGDWDIADGDHRPFREDQMTELFVDRVPYRQSARYREMVAELEQHGRTRFPKCESLEEIDRYFEGVLRLYERIKTEGYRPRDTDADEGEVTVRIGRDGTLIKCGEGTHRLAIARLLKLPAIPVVVDLVHWRWAFASKKKWGGSLEQAVRRELEEMARVVRG